VDPHVARLHGDDPFGGLIQQLTVVRHQQNGLGGFAQSLFQPLLSGYVEVVVGFVEQQYLVGAAQQGFQHQALLLAAGKSDDLTPPTRFVRHA
jgi:hypothetical protein